MRSRFAASLGPASAYITLVFILLGLSAVGCISTSPSANTVPDYDTAPRLQGSLSDVQNRIMYPEQARLHKVTGIVVVDFTVATDGSVIDPHVVQSPDRGDAPVAAMAALRNEALRVARTLRFTPAMKDGVPVEIGMSLPLQFDLN